MVLPRAADPIPVFHVSLMPRVTSLNILFKFPQLWAAAKQTYAATGNFLRMVGIVLFPVAWLLCVSRVWRSC